MLDMWRAAASVASWFRSLWHYREVHFPLIPIPAYNEEGEANPVGKFLTVTGSARDNKWTAATAVLSGPTPMMADALNSDLAPEPTYMLVAFKPVQVIEMVPGREEVTTDEMLAYLRVQFSPMSEQPKAVSGRLEGFIKQLKSDGWKEAKIPTPHSDPRFDGCAPA